MKTIGLRIAAFTALATVIPACGLGGSNAAPPQLAVVSFFPPVLNPGDGQAPLWTQLFVGFNHPLNPATVSPSNITLAPTGGSGVPIGLSYNPVRLEVVVTPAGTLAANTQYTLTIGTGVADTTSDPFAGFQGTFFTTNSGSTSGPPTFGGSTGLTATPGGSLGVIHLAWNTASEAGALAIDYDIYISGASGGENFSAPYTGAGIISPPQTSIDISGFMSGQSYFFIIRAHDNWGNQDRNLTEATAIAP